MSQSMPPRPQPRWQAMLALVLLLGSVLGIPAQPVTTAQDAEPMILIAAGDIACGQDTPAAAQ